MKAKKSLLYFVGLNTGTFPPRDCQAQLPYSEPDFWIVFSSCLVKGTGALKDRPDQCVLHYENM